MLSSSNVPFKVADVSTFESTVEEYCLNTAELEMIVPCLSRVSDIDLSADGSKLLYDEIERVILTVLMGIEATLLLEFSCSTFFNHFESAR